MAGEDDMLVSPDIVDHVRLMYEISWGPVLAVFSEVITLLPFVFNGYFITKRLFLYIFVMLIVLQYCHSRYSVWYIV